jgi:hypothetical protein
VVVGTDVALTGGAVVPNVKTGGALWYNAGRRGTARQPIRHLLIVGVLVSLLDVKAGTLLILVVPLIFFTNIVRLGAPSPTDSASGDPND